MHHNRGSEWNRWDLHVHTPASVIATNYGQKSDDTFDNYVKRLLETAIDNEIVAIGITDYFSIDGYKHIKTILNDTRKMNDLFPCKEAQEKIKKILLLPNVELRLNTFVGEKSSSINYHIIFSDEISLEDIEEDFFRELKFEYDVNDFRTISKKNIELLGKKLKIEQNFSGDDYKVGLEKITVSEEKIISTLKNSAKFKNKYIIAIPIDEDLSSIRWDGRDHQTRKSYIKKADCFFTSNPKTISWALGKLSNSIASHILEFGAIKPCIHGSDAHDYGKLFKPDNNRYCWIKAEPTFCGLQQIIYEPSSRVKIQDSRPEDKTSYNIIESVEINDSCVGCDNDICIINFNQNLNCIIGGKSTGKSLLLNNISNSIDEPQVVKRFNQLTSSKTIAPFLKLNGIKINWKDKTEGKNQRKIIYIPQGYLSTQFKEDENETYIDELVKSVLLQNPEISAYHESRLLKIQANSRKIYEQIEIYNYNKKILSELQDKLIENNTSELIKSEIARLNEEKEKNNTSEILDEDIKQYNKAIENYKIVLESLKKIKNDIDILNNSINIKVDLPFNLTTLSTEIKHEIDKFLINTNEYVKKSWELSKSSFIDSLNDSLLKLNNEKNKLQNEINKLEPRFKANILLKNIIDKISHENKKLKYAKNIELHIKSTKNEISKSIEKLSNLIFEFYKIEHEYSELINSKNTNQEQNLKFKTSVSFKAKQFETFINTKINKRTISSFIKLKDEDFGHNDFTKDFIYNFIQSLTSSKDGTVQLKSGNNINNVIKDLAENWFNVSYDIEVGKDKINYMSPGKKSLTLLKLLIELSDTDCPILLDQPEDDLDNRSVYEDLVSYLKNKKQNRQIIIATHNANIVVGADAENIIIANQDGVGTKNKKYKFEYKNGGIENINCDIDAENILDKHGIQEHICQILEGGQVAFQSRQNKYSFIKE